MTNKLTVLSLLVALSAVPCFGADVVAFPGAEGWGRWAKGARASSDTTTVYHVTNLNDSGKGSFRDAVSQPNRIVVFDVSGVINISSRITFKNNLYVAGQTAPGEGVTIYGDGVSFSGADNLICRYLRVRMGHGGTSGKDCAGVSNGTNMIFDHCSFSWGLDETFSINSDGKGDIGTITIQNCIIGQGLMTHSAGGLIQADKITLYRNLYVDNSTRNNKIKGINQYANNIVYNWNNGCYIMGGDSEGTSYTNIQSNLFINGPAGGGNAFTGANERFHCYGDDNWQDKNADGKLDPVLVTDYSASTRESKPYDYPTLPLYSGKELATKILPEVGASLPYRDQSDYYMVDEVLSYGTRGALITYETALPIGAPSSWSWWSGNKVVDTDKDGMPDWWESANGTDPNKADAVEKAANGYLNIENYINSLTVQDRQFFLRRPITLEQTSATTNSLTMSWRDYTYQEEGFIVEVEMDGVWKEMGRFEADATGCKITGLEPATNYKVRARAYAQHDGETVYSEYSNVASMQTRPVQVDMVDVDNYVADVTNSVEVADGQKLKLYAKAGETLAYELSKIIAPESVVAAGPGTIQISGEAISGTGSVNKDSEGILVLSNKNTYTGATVTHGGTVRFATIANGGVASSIGASQNFAQNWVFDGGTFCYTGASATTDRSARLDQNSTFTIENAATTLTMNGKFEGEGGLTIDGKGTMNVADAKVFSQNGNLRLKGGKVFLSDVENACKAFGETTKTLELAGGCLQFAAKNEDFQNLNFPIFVEDGTTSILSMPTHCYFRSKITGNGNLQFDLPYLRAYLKPDLSGFTGKLIGNGTKAGALFYHENEWKAPQIRFELKGGVTLSSWASNATNVLGGLSGEAGTYLVGTSKQNKGFTCTWEVGAANSDETFHGVINNLPAGGNSAYSGTVSIVKTGTGIWRLTGTNVYSGTTSVKGGTLIVNGKHTGTGAVTVSADAFLMGKGSLASKVTLQSGAELCPGDDVVDGSSLILNKGVSFNAGSTLRIPLAENASGKLIQNNVTLGGSVTLGSGATLELDMTRAEGYHFKRGEAVPVFKMTEQIAVTGSFSIVPATPGEGLEWETSTLFQDGMLRVKNQGEEYTGGAITLTTDWAVLDHTASVQGGSNAAGKFLDSETHYYNNWGLVSWAAQAYTQFSFDVPAGDEIVKAEYSLTVNCAGKYDNRALDICYLPVGQGKIQSESDIPELTAKVGTSVAAFSDIRRSYVTKTVDVTNAVAAIHNAGQNYIVFVMSNGVAGGNIYGKGSSTNAPKLKITSRHDPAAAIETLKSNRRMEESTYDMTGRKVSRMVPGNLYIANGRKNIVKN